MAAGALLIPVSQAGAASDSAKVEITGGSLSFDYSNDIPDFAGVTLTGGQLADQNLATPTVYQVNDGRGTSVGWAVKIKGRTLANAVSPQLRLYCENALLVPCSETGVTADSYYDRTVTATSYRADSTALTTGSLKWDSDAAAVTIAAVGGTEGGTNLPTANTDSAGGVVLGGDETDRTVVNAANDKGLGIFDITGGSNNIQGTFPSTTLDTVAMTSAVYYKVDLDVTLANVGD